MGRMRADKGDLLLKPLTPSRPILAPIAIRMDLEMELLKAVTDLAWNEAKEST